MWYIGIAAFILLMWLARSEGVTPTVSTDLERERLMRELEIEREMKEMFREAFLRQKAMYDRDTQQGRSSSNPSFAA